VITPGSSETKIIPSITNMKLSFKNCTFPKRYPQGKKLPPRVKKFRNTS
jgi:hypothetical protein